jgi:hypothetical protein
LGASQSRVPLELARALQVFGPDAEYVQIEGTGRNALDFHIAYYIGRLSVECADAFFHVISKDTGFDPLIKHLRAQNIFCLRSVTIADLPILKVIEPPVGDKVDTVIEKLISQKASKPRTLKTLGSTIKAHFANQLDSDEIQVLVGKLTQRGFIRVSEGKVTYQLPS